MDRKVEKLLGARIRKLREAQKLTQAQLAELSRKSIETISNFERGQTLPSIRTLHQLANHLGAPLKDLVDFDGTAFLVPDNGLSQRMQLLTKDDRRTAVEFIEFLLARRKRTH
jgi:transcriptional regulator with XRE-family HTH domain